MKLTFGNQGLHALTETYLGVVRNEIKKRLESQIEDVARQVILEVVGHLHSTVISRSDLKGYEIIITVDDGKPS